MTSLYLDTTDHLIYGLLDDEFNWLEYEETQEKKSSALIHKKIYDILAKHNIDISNVENIFTSAGPGSYTGIRLAEGISQVFDWQNIQVYSFYHFEVPKILGVSDGHWVSRAFKGEFYHYSWNENSENGKLVGNLEVDLGRANVFTHFADSELTCLESSKLVKEYGKELFNKVFTLKMKRAPFYFRALENEFKVNRK